MDEIEFTLFTEKYLDHYYRWAEKEHVKNTWFLEGYEPVNKIKEKIAGNGFDYPFVISIGSKPVGFIMYSNLEAYKKAHPEAKVNEPPGTFSMDLYIGEEDYLGKGYGTRIVKQFSDWLLDKPEVKRIIIDPASDNKRAIACYQKAGFHKICEDHDGVCQVSVLEKK